jgi:hypothetical protein
MSSTMFCEKNPSFAKVGTKACIQMRAEVNPKKTGYAKHT